MTVRRKLWAPAVECVRHHRPGKGWRRRTNLVQAQKFCEALEKALLGYTNKQIITAQMIAQLLELAKWVRGAKRHGGSLASALRRRRFTTPSRERVGQRGNEIRPAPPVGSVGDAASPFLVVTRGEGGAFSGVHRRPRGHPLLSAQWKE
jgi:hypothetical protein